MSIYDNPQAPEVRNFELVPEGKHCGVISHFIDCGHHTDTYQGAEMTKHKVFIAWELDCQNSEGGYHWKGDFYTVSDFIDKKTGKPKVYFAETSNFCKLLKAWTGEPGDKCKWIEFTEGLIALQYPAQITIEHVASKKDETKMFSNIDSVKPFKGKTPHKRSKPFVGWTFGKDGFDELPSMCKKMIEASLEKNGGYEVKPREPKAEPAGGVASDQFATDIPF